MGAVACLARMLALSSSVWRAAFGYAPPQADTDVHFALGTLFGGQDVAVTRWNGITQMIFDGKCTATYADTPMGVAATLITQWPPKCVPKCFSNIVAFEDDRGIMRVTFPGNTQCEEETFRSRANRWVDETTQGHISDIDVLYYETFAV